MKIDGGVFRAYVGTGGRGAQISIGRKGEKRVRRNDESSVDGASKTKIKKEIRVRIKEVRENEESEEVEEDKESEEAGEEEASEETGEEKTSEESEKEENAKEGRKVRLKELKAAYMRFCIALLARKSKMREYELSLVCAMAVLGVSKEGWRTPKNYSSNLYADARWRSIR